ncbi:MAG: FmdB family zinc ribbon protein [Planctomycetota bacterium]
MPTYDYVCEACGHRFEHFQTMSSDPLKDCPECQQASLRRLIGTGAALIFKGTGFYCTDYKKPSPDAKVERTKEAAKQVKESSSSSSSSASSGTSSSSGSSSGGSSGGGS